MLILSIKKSRHDLHGLVFYYRHFNINVNWELGLKGPFVDEFCQENGNVEIGCDSITGNSLDNTIEDICVLMPFLMSYNKKIFATVCLKEKAQYMHATFYSFFNEIWFLYGICRSQLQPNQIYLDQIPFYSRKTEPKHCLPIGMSLRSFFPFL